MDVVKNKPLEDRTVSLADKLFEKLENMKNSKKFDVLIILHEFESNQSVIKCIEYIKFNFAHLKHLKFAVVWYSIKSRNVFQKGLEFIMPHQTNHFIVNIIDFDGGVSDVPMSDVLAIKNEIIHLKWKDDSSKLVISIGCDRSRLDYFIRERVSNSEILKKKDIIFQACPVKHESDIQHVLNKNIDRFLKNAANVNFTKELYFLKRHLFKTYEEYKHEKQDVKFKDKYYYLPKSEWVNIQEYFFDIKPELNNVNYITKTYRFYLNYDKTIEITRNVFLGSAYSYYYYDDYYNDYKKSYLWIEIFDDEEAIMRIIDIHSKAANIIMKFEQRLRKINHKYKFIKLIHIGVVKKNNFSFLTYFVDRELSYSELKTPDEQVEEVIQALAHFSYNISQGELLVFDIRPIASYDDSILITEPVIYSKDEKIFASSNLGSTGIKNFMDEHKCNSICYHINKI